MENLSCPTSEAETVTEKSSREVQTMESGVDIPLPLEDKVFPIFQKKFRPKKPDPLQSIQLTIQKMNPPKRKRSLLGKKETEGLNQLVLDAGQKLMGPRVCAECGLMFSPGDYQDEETHRKTHQRLEDMFTLTLWKNAKILKHNLDGSYIILVNCAEESKRVLNKIEDFLSWMDSELGIGSSNPHEKIFLYVFPTKKKNSIRLLGCAVAETLQMQKVVAYSLVSKQNDPDKETFHSTSICVGITRLWTDTNFRRRQIATRLCDAVRFNSVMPGLIIRKSQFGILEPSDEGRAFFSKYTECEGAHYTYRS